MIQRHNKKTLNSQFFCVLVSKIEFDYFIFEYKILFTFKQNKIVRQKQIPVEMSLVEYFCTFFFAAVVAAAVACH